MKAVVYRAPGEPLEVEERETPSVGPGDVLVQVDLCGICASDLLAITGVVTDYSPPVVLGHEVAGRVVESRNPAIRVGAQVTVDAMVSCGECAYCRRDQRKYCAKIFGIGHDVDGGFAEYLLAPKALVDGRGLIRVDDSLPSEAVLFIEPLGCVVNAMDETPFRETVAILGSGSIGLMFLQLINRVGLRTFVFEPLEHRRDRAVALGADEAWEPSEDRIQQVIDATEGGVDTVIVATDNEAAIQTAFSLVRRGGAINFFGLAPKGREITLELEQLHYQGHRIQASWAFSQGSLRDARDLVQGGEIDVASLLTDRYPLDQANEAIGYAQRRDGVKTAFAPIRSR